MGVVHEELPTTPAREQHIIAAGNEACEDLQPEDDDNEQKEKKKKAGTVKTKVKPKAKEPKDEPKYVYDEEADHDAAILRQPIYANFVDSHEEEDVPQELPPASTCDHDNSAKGDEACEDQHDQLEQQHAFQQQFVALVT